MREVPWRVPLSVTLQNGMNRQFCGVYDALDFLENEWPMHGKHQARAVEPFWEPQVLCSQEQEIKEGRRAPRPTICVPGPRVQMPWQSSSYDADQPGTTAKH